MVQSKLGRKKSVKDRRKVKNVTECEGESTVPAASEDKRETVESEAKEDEKKMEKPKDTRVQDIRARLREEFEDRKRKQEAATEKFVKEMAEKKAAERAEIIKQARRIMLYRKPACRKINRALVVSECLKELEAQVAFQNSLKEIDREREMEYINSLKMDVTKHEEEKKQEAQRSLEKSKTYKTELEKQIKENENRSEMRRKEEFKAEKEDQARMKKYLELMKEYEAEELTKKKKKLRRFFVEAIEEKKQHELHLKRDEEFEDRALEVYRAAKGRIRKLHQTTMAKERKEREERAILIAEEHIARVRSADNSLEQRILEKAVAEQERAERERREERKQKENFIREMLKNRQIEAEAAKAKRVQEEKELYTWELMQRLKRDEFDKQLAMEERKREKMKRADYATVLRKHWEEGKLEIKHDKMLEEKALGMKSIIEKSNKEILDYAEELLQESKGVRPLYPIVKAIEECKKEMGLMPPKKPNLRDVEDDNPKRKFKTRRLPTKFVMENKICSS